KPDLADLAGRQPRTVCAEYQLVCAAAVNPACPIGNDQGRGRRPGDPAAGGELQHARAGPKVNHGISSHLQRAELLTVAAGLKRAAPQYHWHGVTNLVVRAQEESAARVDDQ